MARSDINSVLIDNLIGNNLLQTLTSIDQIRNENWSLCQSSHLLLSRKDSDQQPTHLSGRLCGLSSSLLSLSLSLSLSISLTDRQRHLERILLLCESHSIPATQFEITFLMSCLQYESAQCDVVVLEVSLCLSPVSPSSLLICPSPCPVGGLWWRMGCNKCHPVISLHYLLCWSVHLLFRLISVPQG
jgi:hypothetical protein